MQDLFCFNVYRPRYLRYNSTMSIILLMYVLGSAIFLLAIAGHIYVQFLLRPGKDSDLDNYCPEFEDTHPDLVRYHKWYRFTIAAAALGAALIFIALAI